MMVDKQHKGKFEIDADFHEFFFKSISTNGQEIRENDLDLAVVQLGMEHDFKKNTAQVVERTAGSGSNGIGFPEFTEKLYSLGQGKGTKKKSQFDGISDAMTIYAPGAKNNDDDGDIDMKSLKSKKSRKKR